MAPSGAHIGAITCRYRLCSIEFTPRYPDDFCSDRCRDRELAEIGDPS